MLKFLAKTKHAFAWLFGGAIGIFVLSVLFASQSTYAWTPGCTSGNGAMWAACNSGIESPGAAWINGDPNYNLSETATVNDPNAGSVTIYLHGALWNGARAYGAGSELWAVNVQICTSLSSGNSHNDSDNQCRGANRPSYITDYSGSFYRGKATSGWSEGQGNRSGRIYIDLNNFKTSASFERDGLYDKYTAGVWVARCASTSDDGTCDGSTYAADYSTIVIRIKSSKVTTYEARSVVNADGGKAKAVSPWDGTGTVQYTIPYEHKNQVELKFKHIIARTDGDDGMSQAFWKIWDDENSISGTSNYQGPIWFQRGNWLSKRLALPNVSNRSYYKWQNGGNLPSHTWWDNETWDPEWADLTYTVSVEPGQTKQICQGIWYDKTVVVTRDGSQVIERSGAGSPRVCITILRQDVESVPSLVNVSVKRSYIGEDTLMTGRYSFYVDASRSFPTDTGQKSSLFIPKGFIEESNGYIYRKTYCSSCTQAEVNTNQDSSLIRNSYDIISYGGHADTFKEGVIGAIPDDPTLIGYKVCAITAYSTGKTPVGTRTEKYPVSRMPKPGEQPNYDGGTVLEYFEKEVQVYDFFWRATTADCAPIAKRPNVRVTGGTVYSAGGIKTSTSTKTTGRSEGKTFGSWSEYLTIANKEITGSKSAGFGSGASFRIGSDKSNLSPGDMKINSPLTIANNSNSTTMGQANMINDSTSTFIAKLKQFSSSLNATVIDKTGENYLVDSENISGSSDKPTIVYAENITISSSVQNLYNVWLIASDTLNTCDGRSVGDKELSYGQDKCNRPLTVNGLVYANKFQLVRLAGANGHNTLINNNNTSAESFNLPASAFSWSYKQAKSQAKQVSEVYLTELAPRT